MKKIKILNHSYPAVIPAAIFILLFSIMAVKLLNLSHAATGPSLQINLYGASCTTIYAQDSNGNNRYIGGQSTPFTLCGTGNTYYGATQIGLQPGQTGYPMRIYAAALSGLNGPTYSQSEGNCDGSGCYINESGSSNEYFNVTYTTPPPVPTTSISLNRALYTTGDAVTVSWTSNYANNCSSYGKWGGTAVGTSGSITRYGDTGSPGTITYGISCSNSSGAGSSAASATVVSPPTASISLDKSSYLTGDSVTVSWNSSNSNSCSKSGTWGSGGIATSGSQVRSSDTGSAGNISYSLTCQNTSTGRSVTVNASANVSQKPTSGGGSGGSGGSSGGSPPPSGGGSSSGGTSSSGGSSTSSSGGSKSSSGSSSSNKPSSSSSSSGSPATNSNASTNSSSSQPPSAPQGIVATNVGTNVSITWFQSQGGVGGINGYNIDRSTDKQNWQSLAKGINTLTYIDTTVKYATLYYYRVQAYDSTGQTGDYAQVQITSNSFVANLSPTSDLTLASNDNMLSIYLPVGSVNAQTQCTILNYATTDLSSSPSGYVLIAGPYQLICKQEDGQLISKLNKNATVTLTVGQKTLSHYSSVRVFVSSNGKWQAQAAGLDQKTGQFHYQTANLNNVALFGKLKKPNYWIYIILIPLILIAGSVVGIRVFNQYMARKQILSKDEDYRRKEQGL